MPDNDEIIEMEFDPVTVEVDGNAFVLPNEIAAQDFVDKIKQYKAFGAAWQDESIFSLDYLDSMEIDDDCKSHKTPFFSNADDAFGAWRVL